MVCCLRLAMKVTEANMSGSAETFKITANEANSHFAGAAVCNCGTAAAAVAVVASLLLGRRWEEGGAVITQRRKVDAKAVVLLVAACANATWAARGGVDCKFAVGVPVKEAAAGGDCC